MYRHTAEVAISAAILFASSFAGAGDGPSPTEFRFRVGLDWGAMMNAKGAMAV